MQRHRIGICLIFLLALSLLLGARPGEAEKSPAGVTFYFLIDSGACPCQKRACDQAKPIVAQIRNRLRETIEYIEMDYGIEPETTQQFMHKHKLFTFPVILALDENDTELFKAQGELDRQKIHAELEKLGLYRPTQ